VIMPRHIAQQHSLPGMAWSAPEQIDNGLHDGAETRAELLARLRRVYGTAKLHRLRKQARQLADLIGKRDALLLIAES